MSDFHLLNMPDLVMDRILFHCDFLAIHKLRRVCRDIRNYIEDKKPEANLENIYLIGPSVTYEYSNKSIHIKYRKKVGGACSIIYENKEKILENMDFEEVFRNDVQGILRYQKSILKFFQVNFGDFECLQNILNFSQIAAENSEIRADRTPQIISILTNTKPGILKCIGIYESNIRSIEPIKMDEIVELEQWKQAEEAYISKKMMPISLKNFAHFNRGFGKFQSILSTEIRELLQKFVCSSKFTYFCVEYSEIDNIPNILESMGPVYDYFGRQKWFFKSFENCISVLIDSPNNQITFSRIHLMEVPPDAIIQN